MTAKSYISQFRVYYEDTDAGGVVYNANYFKFAERARTEMLRTQQIQQHVLAKKENIVFVVRHIEADIRKPARMDDMLTVETFIRQIKGASLHTEQFIRHEEGSLLVTVRARIACVNRDFKPARIPASITSLLAVSG